MYDDVILALHYLYHTIWLKERKYREQNICSGRDLCTLDIIHKTIPSWTHAHTHKTSKNWQSTTNIYIYFDLKRKWMGSCRSGLVGNLCHAVSAFQFMNNCSQEL